MSKKRSKKRPRKTARRRPQTAAAAGRPARRALPSRFEPDYSYVIQDLKRIGLLAGIFVSLLIALSFFLR